MKAYNNSFKKADIQTFNEPVFKTIGDDWFLLTAGEAESFNTMTASWGTLGILWHKPVAICFIRPTRYTFEFSENSDLFTMSFFTEKERDILQFCGSKSGRNTDKLKETGLSPVQFDAGGIAFEQARMVIECKKIYFDDLKPVFFLPNDIDDKIYPNKDYHRMYIGEIQHIYKK